MTKKRMACVLLVFLILLPYKTALGAENTFVKGKKGSFFAFSWVDIVKNDKNNIYKAFTVQRRSGTSDESMGNLVSDGTLGVARIMKRFLENQPPGKRAVRPHTIDLIITENYDNWFWLDKGVELYIEKWDEILYYYKRLGGPDIDYFIMDYEQGFDVWHIENEELRGGKKMDDSYGQIVLDPRYETEIKPLLLEYGIEMYEGDDKNELYHMYANRNEYRPNTPEKKNVYLGILWAGARKRQYINRVYEALQKHYPDIQMSNYGSRVAAHPQLDATSHGHTYGIFGETLPKEERVSNPIGTHASWSNYGSIHSGLINTPPLGYPFSTFKNTPYNGLLMSIVRMQNTVTYRDDIKIQPWVGCYSYSYGNKNAFATTDYYDELIFHLGMGNPDPFLFYNNEHGQKGLDDDLILSELFNELDEVAGFDDRKTIIEELTPWDSRYILNGMYAGGKNVWRITPDLFVEDMTIDKFLINKNVPAFQIGNQFVEFPEGSFIYHPENEHSKCGYWVISPEGTRPKEYRDDTIPPAPETTYVFGELEELNARVEALKAGAADEKGKAPETAKASAAKNMKRYMDYLINSDNGNQ